MIGDEGRDTLACAIRNNKSIKTLDVSGFF